MWQQHAYCGLRHNLLSSVEEPRRNSGSAAVNGPAEQLITIFPPCDTYNTFDKAVANTVVCSIVCTRLDYCNSLLYGTSAHNIQKLQRVQNSLTEQLGLCCFWCREARSHQTCAYGSFT